MTYSGDSLIEQIEAAIDPSLVQPYAARQVAADVLAVVEPLLAERNALAAQVVRAGGDLQKALELVHDLRNVHPAAHEAYHHIHAAMKALAAALDGAARTANTESWLGYSL